MANRLCVVSRLPVWPWCTRRCLQSGGGAHRASVIPSGQTTFLVPPSECTIAMVTHEFRAFPLASKNQLTHDTWRLRFALPSNQHVLGMIVTSSLTIRVSKLGSEQVDITHSYTACSTPDQRGWFDLIVKQCSSFFPELSATSCWPPFGLISIQTDCSQSRVDPAPYGILSR